MASPVTTQTARPLDGLDLDTSGPPELTCLAAQHLRLLGARTRPEPAAPQLATTARIALTGDGILPIEAEVNWADPESGITDEATVQAATGIMAVHGRRDGGPRGLAVDYATTAASVLTVQGILAGLLGQARGGTTARVSTSVDRAGLLTVSQYLAAAGADEGEAAELAPGGPPFADADGTLFELETLDPGAWAAFWRALEAPPEAIPAAGGPSNSGTPQPALLSRRPCIRRRGPTPGSASSRRQQSPAQRSARWDPWPGGQRNTTVHRPGHSPPTGPATVPPQFPPRPNGRWQG